MDPNRVHDHWSNRWSDQEPLERKTQAALSKSECKLGGLPQNYSTVYEICSRTESQIISHQETDAIFDEEDLKVLPCLLALETRHA